MLPTNPLLFCRRSMSQTSACKTAHQMGSIWRWCRSCSWSSPGAPISLCRCNTQLLSFLSSSRTFHRHWKSKKRKYGYINWFRYNKLGSDTTFWLPLSVKLICAWSYFYHQDFYLVFATRMLTCCTVQCLDAILQTLGRKCASRCHIRLDSTSMWRHAKP